MLHMTCRDTSTVPVRWLPENSKSSSWSQCLSERLLSGVALANSRLAKCQSRIWRSREERYTSLGLPASSSCSFSSISRCCSTNRSHSCNVYNGNTSIMLLYSNDAMLEWSFSFPSTVLSSLSTRLTVSGISYVRLGVWVSEVFSTDGYWLVYKTLAQITSQMSEESIPNPNSHDEIPDTANHVKKYLSGAVPCFYIKIMLLLLKFPY